MATEKNSVESLKNYIHYFGGWPVLEGDNWEEKNFNWQEIIYDMHKAGFGSSCLLRIYVFLDPKNSARTVLFVNICRQEPISTMRNSRIRSTS